MGAVGSFQRIQEFLNTDVREDKRRRPTEVDLLVHRHDQFARKGSSISQMTGDTHTEKSDPTITPAEDSLTSSFDAITVRDAVIGWDTEKDPLLQSINMVVPREKVTMIVGPVGCGKSVLLKALLGEVPTVSGSIGVSSVEIAFCDQTPWHMNGTIQQSIIGVSPLEELWYETILSACALEEDIRQLSRGDQTPIGSKGISLSGGQSQRIVSLNIPPRKCN